MTTMHTIYLGSRRGTHWLASDVAYVLQHTKKWFKFATIIEATGIYRSQVVPTLLIKVASVDTAKVILLAANFGTIHEQSTVGVEYDGRLRIVHPTDYRELHYQMELDV